MYAFVNSQLLTEARPIASAVIIPTQPPEVTIVLPKRRQSPTSNPDSKKQRLDKDDIPQPHKSPEKISTNEKGIAVISTEKKDERRRISVVEEKKRGQRLLGTLLNALSQGAPNGNPKRRLETQKRQNERSKAQNTQDASPRGLQLTKLNSVRKKEQMKFDEESVSVLCSEI